MKRLDLLIKDFDNLSEGLKVLKEQLQEENEGFFNAIVENSSNFIAIIQNEKIVFMNSSALAMLKAKTSVNILGQNFSDFILAADKRKVASKELIKPKSAQRQLQLCLKAFDGSFVDCESTITQFVHKGQQSVLIIGRDVTEELKDQLKLFKEQKLRTDILNGFEEVIAFYSPDHEFIWLNDAGKKQLNIKDDSYIGKLCYKLWFHTNKPCATCPVVTRKIDAEERILRFHGNRIWKVRNTPLFNEKGKLTGYVEFRTDITEKENYKIELEKNHSRQIQAESTNLFGNIEIDLSTKRIELSPGARNILGIDSKKEHNISYNDLFKFLHPDDSHITLKFLKEAVSEGKSIDRIFKIYDTKCIEKTIRGIGDVKNEKPAGEKRFFGVIQDITKMSNLEKQVFDERSKYKMLAENAPFGLVLTQNNKPVYINRTFLEWLDVKSISEFERNGVEDFFLQEDKLIAHEMFKQIRDNNVPYPTTKKIRLKEIKGKIRHVRLDLKNSLINNMDYVQIVFTDITDDVIKEKKQKQITADALYINQKNSMLLEIESALNRTLKLKQFQKHNQHFRKIFDIIENYKQLDKDWKILVANFEEVHPGFFSKLNKEYPNLSPVDIKHCACIKMNMDTKEIARFFNIKVTSVQMSRVRIKKKMNLPEDSDLRNHILNF